MSEKQMPWFARQGHIDLDRVSRAVSDVMGFNATATWYKSMDAICIRLDLPHMPKGRRSLSMVSRCTDEDQIIALAVIAFQEAFDRVSVAQPTGTGEASTAGGRVR